MEPLIEASFSELPVYFRDASLIQSYFEKVLLCCYRKDGPEEVYVLTNVRAICASLKSRRNHSTRLEIQHIRFADVHRLVENKLRSLWSGQDTTRLFLFNQRSQPVPCRGFAFPAGSALLPRFLSIVQEQVSVTVTPQTYPRLHAGPGGKPHGLILADMPELKKMSCRDRMVDENSFLTLREERLREALAQERRN